MKGGKGLLDSRNAITGVHLEFNTLTCVHCNRVVVLNPERKRERHTCLKCNAYVCDSPGCNTDCNPIQEGIELALKYPEKNQPFLLRGPGGEVLFDLALRDKRRIH